jgi:hypothetical protein
VINCRSQNNIIKTQSATSHSNTASFFSRLMIADVFESAEKTMEYNGGNKHRRADFPFNFYLKTNIGRESSAHDIKNTIEQWMSNLPDSKWTKWVVSFCITNMAGPRKRAQH